MPADKNKQQSDELERLVRRADHLSNFGTLTSLVSTAAYFIEGIIQKVQKKSLSNWVQYSTLAAVGAGIVSVLASYYYKLKAGRIALYSPAHLETDTGGDPKAAPESPALSKTGDRPATDKNWVAGMEARQNQAVQNHR